MGSEAKFQPLKVLVSFRLSVQTDLHLEHVFSSKNEEASVSMP